MTEPSSFKEAVEDPTWVDAMVEEYDSIVKNSSWEIVPRPEGKSVAVRDGSTKCSRQLTRVWRSTRQYLLPESSHR